MLDRARAFLERKGVPEARLDADLLLAHALGVDRLQLLLRLEEPAERSQVDRARELLVRRGQREPAAYITGSREFYARPFRVCSGVLVPRPESELLIDLARDHHGRDSSAEPRVLDLGTGSGCLAVTLALELPAARVSAVDVCAQALRVAQENCQALGARVQFSEGDGLQHGDKHAPWDLVLCNPPYIDPATREGLAPEVLEHEPHLALFAPPGDPDHWLRELSGRARSWLSAGGLMLIEIGHDQAARARDLGRESGCRVKLENDLAGIPRVLCLQAPGGS